jgi:hypothetical protein
MRPGTFYERTPSIPPPSQAGARLEAHVAPASCGVPKHAKTCVLFVLVVNQCYAKRLQGREKCKKWQTQTGKGPNMWEQKWVWMEKRGEGCMEVVANW